jgi:orotidine-5'-phosphate decarboxylase
MIRKVKEWRIGDYFGVHDDKVKYQITSFPTRSMVCGINTDFKLGEPITCKVSISQVHKLTAEPEEPSPSSLIKPEFGVFHSMKDRIFIALDTADAAQAKEWVNMLSPYVNCFKVGLELFYSSGFEICQYIKDKNKLLFFDGKFADIYTTVNKASKVLTLPDVFNAHCITQGSIEGAVAATKDLPQKPKVLGVTILTSMTSEHLERLGLKVYNGTVFSSLNSMIVNMSQYAKKEGAVGVVCSAQEVGLLKTFVGQDFITVTPGIRPAGSDNNEQKRVVTPKRAFNAGTDYIVIGRPITQPPSKFRNPVEAMESLMAELQCIK